MGQHEGLSEFQELQVEKIATSVVNKMDEKLRMNFVCSEHCGKRRSQLYIYIMWLFFLVVLSLGWRGIELLKILI